MIPRRREVPLKDSQQPLSLVLDVVSGKAPWSELRRVGLSISFMDDGCDCEGAGFVVATPTVPDIAAGFVRLSWGSGTELRRWASVMLAASAVIDLGALESHPDGERMLSAIWDASAGVPIDDSTIAVIRRLAGTGSARTKD